MREEMLTMVSWVMLVVVVTHDVEFCAAVFSCV